MKTSEPNNRDLNQSQMDFFIRIMEVDDNILINDISKGCSIVFRKRSGHKNTFKPQKWSSHLLGQATIKYSQRYFTVKPHVDVLLNAHDGGKIQFEFNAMSSNISFKE